MDDNTTQPPVQVTGDERRHPAIRKLARACIELARLQLEAERSAPEEQPEDTEAPLAKPPAIEEADDD